MPFHHAEPARSFAPPHPSALAQDDELSDAYMNDSKDPRAHAPVARGVARRATLLCDKLQRRITNYYKSALHAEPKRRTVPPTLLHSQLCILHSAFVVLVHEIRTSNEHPPRRITNPPSRGRRSGDRLSLHPVHSLPTQNAPPQKVHDEAPGQVDFPLPLALERFPGVVEIERKAEAIA